MLSGLVYAAAAQVSNRFELCSSVSLATRKLHVPFTPVGTTIGRVLNTMAHGGYERAMPAHTGANPAKLEAMRRIGTPVVSFSLGRWGSAHDFTASDVRRALGMG